MSGNSVQIDTVGVAESAARLDALADRLEENLRTNSPALQVQSAGVDEVSFRAAGTMTDVGASYESAVLDGINEMRKLAANLRGQATGFAKMEDDNAAVLGAKSV